MQPVAARRRSPPGLPPLPPPSLTPTAAATLQAAQAAGSWAEAFEAERQGLLRGVADPITPQLVMDELRRQGSSCVRLSVVPARRVLLFFLSAFRLLPVSDTHVLPPR